MRLVRSVVAGIVLGVLAGYAAALLRPRTVHRAPTADVPGLDVPPLPERHEAAVPAEIDTVGLDPAEVPR
jgi:hypothetical protein